MPPRRGGDRPPAHPSSNVPDCCAR
jgi:hypothetical protein